MQSNGTDEDPRKMATSFQQRMRTLYRLEKEESLINIAVKAGLPHDFVFKS